MEVELPDPASIWKELGEFQSTVDSYVKQQADLADRLRRANAEFCQDQKSTPFILALKHCIRIVVHLSDRFTWNYGPCNGQSAEFDIAP